MKRVFTLFLIMLMLAGCSTSAADKNAGIRIEEAWARPAMRGGNTAAYFTIENDTAEPDRLLSARCSAAVMTQVHRTVTGADGTSKMMHQETLDIPAGEKTVFEPGGLHVMLMDLNADLKAGQIVTITLDFEKSGAVQVEAVVREP